MLVRRLTERVWKWWHRKDEREEWLRYTTRLRAMSTVGGSHPIWKCTVTEHVDARMRGDWCRCDGLVMGAS